MRPLSLFALAAAALQAQAPVQPLIFPRGITNFFTQAPAPATVPRGGILQITGLNLGPAEEMRARSAPLPMALGEPRVEVLLNGAAIPLFSVSPGRILAQVPNDAPNGLVEVAVRRGEQTSRPARVRIAAMAPSVRTVEDRGYGQPWGAAGGSVVNLTANGLGPTEPAVPAGQLPGDANVAPAAPLTAYVGGRKTSATARLSTTRVGEFDVEVTVPPSARPGDLITLAAAGAAANRTVLGAPSQPELQRLALPEGAEIRALETSDLNGNYVIATGARRADGCYTAWLFDFTARTSGKVADCLTVANAQAVSPVVPAQESNVLAALVGPATGTPPAGIATQVMLFSPDWDAPKTIDLPAPGLNLTSAPGGNFAVTIPGATPPLVLIDSEAGTLRDAPGGGLPGGGGAGGLGGLALDVEGLTVALSAPQQVAQGRFGLIVGDNADAPERARFAVIAPNGEVALSKEFPQGWSPVLTPRTALPPQAQQQQQLLAAPRNPVLYDNVRRLFYTLARNGDRQGFVAFTLDRAATTVAEFPSGWFAATCAAQLRILNVELSRRVVVMGTNVAETEIKNPCPALGFLQLDLGNGEVSVTSVPEPVATQQVDDVNDFIYVPNIDNQRRNAVETIYVLDGVTGSTFTLGLPSSITYVQNLVAAPQISALIGTAGNRALGDAGIAVFDLDRAEVRVLPVPDGFTAVQEVGTFLTTRRLVARGNRTGGRGTQLMAWDLLSGDLALVNNPEGVVSLGPAAAAAQQPGGGQLPGGGQGPGGGGQVPGGGQLPGGGQQQPQAPQRLLDANLRANTVAAVALNEAGRQVAVTVTRIP